MTGSCHGESGQETIDEREPGQETIDGRLLGT